MVVLGGEWVGGLGQGRWGGVMSLDSFVMMVGSTSTRMTYNTSSSPTITERTSDRIREVWDQFPHINNAISLSPSL